MKKCPRNITLTTDQEKAINSFLDFLVSEENFFVIQGPAGTGKSFLIKYLLETFYSRYSAYCLLLQKELKPFDVKITATTNKAANVIRDFLKGSPGNFEISNIYSLFGLKVTNDYKTGKTSLSFNGGTPNPFANDAMPLIFIDEASFVGADLHSIIQEFLKDHTNAKVVYMGDQYQLAPVGETFSAMESLTCGKASLDEIVRNEGHIQAMGLQFRRTVESGLFLPLRFNDLDFIHVDGPTFQALVESSFAHPHWTSAHSKVIAWQNERVQEYNAHIRSALGLPGIFQEGELVITNEFIKGNKHYSRSMDSEVTVTKMGKDIITRMDVPGRMVELDDTYVAFMPNDFKEAKAKMKEFAALKQWKDHFEIKENWLDLQAIYASSVHKAQGSTYDTVFLDLTDIGRNWNAADVARLLYVGITRAAKRVVCYGQLPKRYS